MPGFCLPHPPKRPRVAPEVDKNGAKSLNFVYRGLVSRQLGSAAKISLHAAHLHSALSKCSIASPLHPKALDFTKKNRRKSDGS